MGSRSAGFVHTFAKSTASRFSKWLLAEVMDEAGVRWGDERMPQPVGMVGSGMDVRRWFWIDAVSFRSPTPLPQASRSCPVKRASACFGLLVCLWEQLFHGVSGS